MEARVTFSPVKRLRSFIFFAFFLLIGTAGTADDCFFLEENLPNQSSCDLLRDLAIANYWEEWANPTYPVPFNTYLSTGYINMPSARMAPFGLAGAGYSYQFPYENYNLFFQPLSRMELSGSYRVFKGVEDTLLSQFGFGDRSDKGMNVKFKIIEPEDSDGYLPEVAFGMEDFLGSRLFHSKYLVASKFFKSHNLELSFGYGWERFDGFFGGFAWWPFLDIGPNYLERFSIVGEYDATDFKSDPHHKAHQQDSPFNFGLQYYFWDYCNIGVSWVKGNEGSVNFAFLFPLGTTPGLLPYYDDPIAYHSPVVTEPIGIFRDEYSAAQDLVFALQKQGFNVFDVTMDADSVLYLRIENWKWRIPEQARRRLEAVLCRLCPENVSQVVITWEARGVCVQQLRYCQSDLARYRQKCMGIYELRVLSPLEECSSLPCERQSLYGQGRPWWTFVIRPRMKNFFGSSNGKFKYTFGVLFGPDGYLPGDVFYSLRIAYPFLSTLDTLGSWDILNPSQVINVRTDLGNYYKRKELVIDRAYLQKSWNLGCGWYGRAALGYFELMYAGVAAEVLYYPVDSPWAIGFEAALLKKRSLDGLKLESKIRRLRGSGDNAEYLDYTGTQYFLNLYYDFKELDAYVQLQLGEFLAHDRGYRLTLGKRYPSGLKVFAWTSYTTAHDVINGSRYHDQGIGFSMPLEIFYTRHSRVEWGYSMSSWLRDVGQSAGTGVPLYPTIHSERV